MRLRSFAALLGVLAVAALVPSAASAHPLGNFTTNQLVTVSIDEREADLGVVLDLAEIPSFQLAERYDSDGDGAISGAERAPLQAELEREVEAGLGVKAQGMAASPRLDGTPTLSFPEGQAGLPLTRLELAYAAPLPPATRSVEVTNEAFAERTGWRAIQVLPGNGTDVRSSVPATDPTDGLRVYPKDLLQSPADDRSASFEVSPGSGAVSAPDGVSGGEVTEDRGAGGFAGLLTGGDTHGLLILLLLGAAFGWGALHALSPGHGKAMVAGYLAGSRGRPRHAVALGLTVTATHTVSVFALGLVTLAASQYILPEDLYPWLGLVSGLMVVAIGFWVMRTRYRRWRRLRDGDQDHGHHHHQHGHDHDHDHDHGDAPIRTRELLGLGVSGGLIPCPSALVVLVAAISQHRIGLGMVLILAFSIGLAATVTAVGLVTIWGKRLVARLRPEQKLFGGRLSGALPAISASVIVLVGLLITYRAIPMLG
jgi:nickel/cobalt transporter (NicO) family protein